MLQTQEHTHAPRIRAGVPALLLAPMEGVTDATMRALMSELSGFTFCVAEFLRISQAVPGPQVFRKHVPELTQGGRTASGLPVQVQLLGGDPDKLAQAARVAALAGAQAVDLNFGCPARTVNRHDGGATLLQYPERIRAIVSTVRAALPATIPVSAKLRLGWDDMRAIHVNSEQAAEAGASWITIHARTKTQGYRPPAYWKPLREVRARLRVPVVANGEIWTIDDLRRCRDETGCEHFMLGRGALADPSLSRSAARELGFLDTPRQRSLSPSSEWPALIRRFVTIGARFGLPAGARLARIKQWLHLCHYAGKLHWFETLKRCTDLGELLDQLEGLATAEKRATATREAPS
jgi:tRNA-dihydrouridine synthase C